jgi:CRISPR-associated endoribonuclease Cas6
MLSRFELTIECEKNFANRNMGSLFHGILMEKLPTEYVEKLHENNLKPFSQYILPCEEGMKWVINCLNDECGELFEKVLMHGCESVELKGKERILPVCMKSMNCISYKKLIDTTYFGNEPKFICVRFRTPVSFKNEGRYSIFPDMSMIYKNLMRKFDTFSNEYSMYDEEVMKSLVEKSIISSYDLKSTVYHLESIKIPAFYGKITIKNNGAAQLRNLAGLLFKFSEFSGIGIKTALGMGAAETEEVKSFAER